MTSAPARQTRRRASHWRPEACELTGDLRAALGYQKQLHAFYVQTASQAAQRQASEMAVVCEADQLKRTSLGGALTGIANRLRFDQMWRHELPPRAAPKNGSLALLDIDRIKRLIDRFSHAVGDEMWRRVGALLARRPGSPLRRRSVRAGAGRAALVDVAEE